MRANLCERYSSSWWWIIQAALPSGCVRTEITEVNKIVIDRLAPFFSVLKWLLPTSIPYKRSPCQVSF